MIDLFIIGALFIAASLITVRSVRRQKREREERERLSKKLREALDKHE